MQKSFDEFPLHPGVLERLSLNPLGEPTAVQEAVIPLFLEGRDLVVHAGPHSGETMAYGLPLLSMFDPLGKTQALVIVPSAERAARVYKRLAPLAQGVLKISPLFEAGGPQEAAARRGVDILIGTPFLIKDLFAIKQLDLNGVRTLVLDGADRLMATVQRRDVEYLLDRLPRLDQTALFFWNVTEGVEAIAHHMKDPATVEVAALAPPAPPNEAPAAPEAAAVDPSPEKTSVVCDRAMSEGDAPMSLGRASQVRHLYLRIETEQRTDKLLAALEHDAPEQALILARNKHEARRLAQRLEKFGKSSVDSFNADTSASQRQAALKRFQSGERRFLVVPEPASGGCEFGGPGAIFLTGISMDPALYHSHSEAARSAGRDFQSVSLVTPEAEAVFSELRKGLEFGRHVLDPGPQEESVVAESNEGVPPPVRRGRGGARVLKGSAALHNESLASSKASTGPLAPLPRMRTTWQTFKVSFLPGVKPSRDSFHGWLAQATGIARSSMRSIQLFKDYATVDVEERQAQRFQESLKDQLLG
ncbi:MAG: DEAD/DEAH box helicase [Candidatus Sericytochromatia bacterium]|nr:DEAD/DEAH box helicase [Candidatus Sericytochromatia bacterium]